MCVYLLNAYVSISAPPPNLFWPVQPRFPGLSLGCDFSFCSLSARQHEGMWGKLQRIPRIKKERERVGGEAGYFYLFVVDVYVFYCIGFLPSFVFEGCFDEVAHDIVGFVALTVGAWDTPCHQNGDRRSFGSSDESEFC